MSFYDLMDELNSMADFATNCPDDQVDKDSIQRWQTLFGYTQAEALAKLESHRANHPQTQLSNSQWELIRADKQHQGHYKESYEHALYLLASNKPTHTTSSLTDTNTKESKAKYLLRMEGPLCTLPSIQTLASHDANTNSNPSPPIHLSKNENGTTTAWCLLAHTQKQTLLSNLAITHPHFTPFLVPYRVAERNLSSTSHHPTLGMESTLPHHRLCNDEAPSPAQGDYPVWYFFYGTLCDAEKIKSLTGDEEPVYRKARVRGGRLTMWEGKYMALVDGEGVVEGSAYLVRSQEEEDALRGYETDKYEVVRCVVEMVDGKRVKGLTFRFVG
ncbi:hypothetical protein QBC34DRAFT_492933 [Podospora aff. communis PSN243]|uniref:Putative gamma-glutamylcyclotransferase n=1 Tax=Podospora aff. communis PSN243 TaxID=3040156 RepID=A0AAV9GVJ6_9PEZI|nr:hypothetical protein QBC34DRAFT_492933 [Podospora aff. communis PSN243]